MDAAEKVNQRAAGPKEVAGVGPDTVVFLPAASNSLPAQLELHTSLKSVGHFKLHPLRPL